MRRAAWTVAIGVGAALVLVPVASAHGIHGDGSGGVLEYARLGMRHMLAGWDHLLFISGIVILAASITLAVELLTAFALGHSITLLAATLAGWQVSPEIVDMLIGASVVFVGWRLMQGQPRNWRLTAVVVFGFGLIHGLGLAARLQQLELPEGGALVARVIAFNIGVELGQVVAIAVLFGLGALGLRAMRELPRFDKTIGGALAAVGLLIVAVLSFGYARPDAEARPTEAVPTVGCIERDPPQASSTLGGHPQRTFYGPSESVDEAGLAHVLGDGYVVVRYHPSLPKEQIQRLRRWATTSPFALAVAPARSGADYRIAAITRATETACGSFELQRIASFTKRSHETIRRGNGG